MTRSVRANGARAGRPVLRALLLAGTATMVTSLALAACSASAMSGGGAGSHRRLAEPAGVPAPVQGAAPKTANGSAFPARVTLSAQSIIYTANLAVRVKKDVKVSAAAEQVTAIVTAAGGYVSGEQLIILPGRHRVPQVSLVLKIPVAQFHQILPRLSALGRQIELSQHAQDVTQRVADVNSRVTSAQAAITQLRALLRKAGSVSELLSVTEEINTQESNLEALLAQQRALAHQTSYATVSMEIVGHHARIVEKHKKTSPGFLAGLRGGWHALGLVVGWVLTALGSALPFLVLAILIGGLAIGGRRRLARRKSPPAADPPAAAAS